MGFKPETFLWETSAHVTCLHTECIYDVILIAYYKEHNFRLGSGYSFAFMACMCWHPQKGAWYYSEFGSCIGNMKWQL